MKLNTYQQRSSEFVSVADNSYGVVGWTVGLAGECGEVAELIKKSLIRRGHLPPREELVSEIGDVLFYLCRIAEADNITLDEIAKYNLDKLEKRYGKAK